LAGGRIQSAELKVLLAGLRGGVMRARAVAHEHIGVIRGDLSVLRRVPMVLGRSGTELQQ
jgi:hypothetical protein